MSKIPAMLTAETAVLLVVDVQERLMPTIHESDGIITTVGRMIRAAGILEVPVVVTEQYPAGLGPTCAAIRDLLGETPIFEKTRFSACVEPVVEHLGSLGRPNVIVVGIETHVCVQQTVLDLLRLGYMPYVCADAVSSRVPLNRDVAMTRMQQAGAVVTTTESVIFEALGESGTDRFKAILTLVK